MTAVDADLVTRAKQNDPDAFAEIYERYASPLYRYIYCRVGNAEVAEDLRGEVFLRLVEGLSRYEDRGWPISSWLYRIAHDRTVDLIRRQRTARSVPLDHSCTRTCDGPEQIVEVQLDREELHGLVDNLTPEQSSVIRMRFLQEMSIPEVAEALGRTTGSVKSLQHRGLMSLGRMMAG